MIAHPLEPGESSAVEPGPWHYGADYIAVHFRADPRRLATLVPRPFIVERGDCLAYVCGIVSVAEGRDGAVSSEPERTQYSEAAVGVRCSFKGRVGVFYPIMWVTSEWSLLRGLLNGYQKRLADRISMTKLHPLNPGLNPVGAGARFMGFCVKGPQQVLSLEVEIERQGDRSDLPSFGSTFGIRKYPRTDDSQGLVDEPVEILKSNSKVSDIWTGKGSLKTEVQIGSTTPLSGAVYRSGFTVSGSRVLT